MVAKQMADFGGDAGAARIGHAAVGDDDGVQRVAVAVQVAACADAARRGVEEGGLRQGALLYTARAVAIPIIRLHFEERVFGNLE